MDFPKEKTIGFRILTPSVLHFEVPSAIINIFYGPILLNKFSLLEDFCSCVIVTHCTFFLVISISMLVFLLTPQLFSCVFLSFDDLILCVL